MSRNSKKLRRVVIIILSILIFTLIILSPEQSLSAALKGLKTWLNIVLPALLPFLIIAEAMIELGIVDFLSVILYPIMKPLFNCPGESSFIWIMSITSGYPMGAKLIASFYEKGSLTKEEGQRMLAFCNTSGPLFMIGAVGIGMLGSKEAGNIIAISHYSASILLGLLFSFYGRKSEKKSLYPSRPSMGTALNSILAKPPKKDQSLGIILGDAVKNSMNSQLLIGGFIILFSVIISMFMENKIMDELAYIINSWALTSLNPLGFLKPIFAGILEVTAGCTMLAKEALTVETKLALLSFLIGWGGFSIHSQAISFLANTDLSMGLYLVSKLLHGFFSSIITFFLVRFIYTDSIPTFAEPIKIPTITWSTTFMASIQLMLSALLALVALILFGILVTIIKKRSEY